LAASHILRDLPPGLYHIYPDSGNLTERLQKTIEHQGRTCLVFPPNIADYLVTDTVRREAAFDLENQGISGEQLIARVEEIVREGPLHGHLHQRPTTLSGGEQQLLAVTTALQQPHEFLIGRHCFDFLSVRNVRMMHDHLRARGKRLLEITYRNGQEWPGKCLWQFDGERLEAVPAAPVEVSIPEWPPGIPPWRLVAESVEKHFDDSAFTLRIPALTLDKVRCLGIAGDNGSGKSTLADCLTGLAPYTGRLAVELPGIDSPRTGYLMQHAETPTHGLTVHDIIQRFVNQGRLIGWQGEQVESFLQESPHYRPLAARDARTGHRLVIVAALLSGNYDLVILDEPTYGLPIQSVTAFLVQAAGDLGVKPLLLISHDGNFLTLFCDTIIHLDDGAVYEPTV